MRVKAFSLIELIVVIMLIGIIYFLVISTYTNKQNSEKKLSVKDMPSFIKNIAYEQSSVFYLYGQKCKKSVIRLEDKTLRMTSNFSLTDKYNMLTCKPNGEFDEFVPFNTKIDKKEEHICLKINFKDGKFYDKLIVTSTKKTYVFIPFFQEVQIFDDLEFAKKVCKKNLYAKSIDEYYHE